jgi:septal ring factor EnvC (AmiA/AmiB activator)
MRTTISRRGLILSLSFLTCVLMVNALSPVYGRAQDDDLKKQVASLTKKVEDQKKQLDSLTADYERFKATEAQFNKGINDAITQRDAVMTQHGNAITNINARLRARGI